MWKSLVAFAGVFGRAWYFLAADALGNVVGLVQMFRTDFSLGWVIATIACATLLLVAAFAAFHQMRLERDRLEAERVAQRTLSLAKDCLRMLANNGEAVTLANLNALELKRWFFQACGEITSMLGPERAREFSMVVVDEVRPFQSEDDRVPSIEFRNQARTYGSWLRARADQLADVDVSPDWLERRAKFRGE